MIPVIPSDKPMTREERLKAYRDERDKAAYDFIAKRMDQILHSGDKNQPLAEVEYDILGR